ncbi:MAG: tetratricopeptide repeat protein [Candidatus Omnitrophica bacterium]|nr:tetratricopeptide repeat protein [Candidatus Omnitrophota bacterium]MCM8770498.1 tetratricopeptide repeat protein [Candidatus Omnitrophota bacterium]
MTRHQDNCLVLDIEQEKDRLRMCIFLKEESSTVRHYAYVGVSFPEVNRLSRSIILFLNKADKFGTLDSYSIAELKKTSQLLYELLLDKTVKERLKEAAEKNLILSLDESIAYLPWEILYDGNDFLCLKFNLGRNMRIKDMTLEPRYKIPALPLKMLILANPQGDLPSSAREAVEIKNRLDKRRDIINVDFKINNISGEYVKKNLRDYDILHYAGHAQYSLDLPQDSGWILEDTRLKARDILKIGESGSMPVLVFANACETATQDVIALESESEVYSLVRSFLVTGTRHYIASLCKIPDEAARLFANEFFVNLILDNKTVGEAARVARLALIREFGENQISWMDYLVFGDPTFRFSQQPFNLTFKKHTYKKRFLKLCITLSLATVAVLLIFKMLSGGTSKIDLLYAAGRNEELITLCNNILVSDADNLKALNRLGEVFERKGKRDKALEYYFKYVAACERKGELKQLAAGLIKIGWEYYLKGDYPKAFIFYNRAIEQAGKTKDALNLATALRKLALWYIDKEDYEKAWELLFKSSEINRQRQNIPQHRYNLACDYFDLGLIFTDKDDLNTARDFYNKSMQIFKTLKAIPEMSDYYSNMAELYRFNKEYHKAEQFYRLSLDLDKKMGNLPSEAATYNMLGEMYLEMKDYTRAEENFINSLHIQQDIEDLPGLAWVYHDLGQLYKEKGQRDKAQEYLIKAQGIYKNIDTPDYRKITEEIKDLADR